MRLQRSLSSAGAILCLAVGSWQSCGQTTDVSATVQFSNGQNVSIDDFSDTIGVQPGEVVSVTIQFTPDAAGEPVQMASLDGGTINGPGVISDDGTFTFGFQAPGNSGQIRILVRHGLRTLRLLFWVLSSNPENNPPVVTPANQ